MKGKQLPKPKTIYILKKSTPKKQPRNVYILTKSSNNSPIDSDDVPIQSMTNPPHNVQVLDTLSIYKKSQLPSMNATNSHDFLSVDEPAEGVFTPHKELSDGDITIDNGTDNSLDSQSEEEQDKTKAIPVDQSADYKHKPRVTVREQLLQAKKTQPPLSKPVNRGKPVKTKIPTTKVFRPPLKKKVPVAKPETVLAWESNSGPPLPPSSEIRSTLLMQKPAHQKPIVRDQNKLAPDVNVIPKRPVKVTNYLPQPKTSHITHHKKPVRQPPKQHVRILESPSDSDSNEVFKRVSLQRSPRPPPSQRQKKANAPPNYRRGNNGLVRIGKVY